MLLRLPGILAFACCMSTTAYAVPVEIRFTVSNGAPVADGSVLTLKRRQAAGTTGGQTYEITNGAVRADLTPDRWSWRITPGVYVQPAGSVIVPEAGGRLTIELERAAVMSGSLAPTDGAEREFHLVALASGKPHPCDVAERDFTCLVPLGHRDVTVLTSGWPPLPLGELKITAEGVQLGELELPRRAAVTGEIDAPDGVPLRLVPAVRAGDADQRSRVAEASEGRYRFDGVSSGRYRIEVPRETGPPLLSDVIQVPETGTLEVRVPITIPGAGSLSLQLVPAADPRGEGWRVDLLPVGEGLRSPDAEIRLPAADPAGRLELEDLPEGRYIARVTFRDSGAAIASKVITVDRDRTTIEQLTLAPIHLKGRVTIGGAPPAAGMLEIMPLEAEMNLDPEGRFETWLPREGEYWLAAVIAGAAGSRRVDVRSADGGVARLDVNLALRQISGRVVDWTSAPSRAVVTARWETDVVDVSTREDGTFSLRVPADERVTIRAARRGSEGADSAAASRDLIVSTFEETPHVKLDLRPLRPLTVSLSRAGKGVRLEYIDGGYSVDLWQAFDSELEIRVPDRAQEPVLVVLPPSPESALQAWRVPDHVSRHTIDLATGSGTLVLEIGGALTEAEIPSFSVYWDGAPVPLRALRAWAKHFERGWPEAGRLVIPTVAPGELRVCAIERDDQRRESEGTCVSERLFEGELLKLAVPAVEEE